MTSRTTVSIIIVGDEILKGQTKDTNSHFLCKELYECGVEVARISVVPDDVDIIAEEIRSNSKKYSFVFTSGGIGPTHDDLTYEGIAKAFDENVALNKDLQKILNNLCMKMGLDEKAAVKMSYVPLSSEIHLIYTSKKNMSFPVVSVKNVFAFSGIPSYLEFTFNELKSMFCTNSREYILRTLYIDRTEFTTMNILNAAVKKFNGVVKFGSYPDVNNQYYQVKLTIEADSEKAVSDAEAYLRSHLPHNSVVGRFPPSCPEALSLLENVFLRKSETFDKEFSTTVEESLKILDQCFDKYRLPNVCLSFNGGKDCTALLHLTHLYLAKFYTDRSEKLKVLYVRSKDPFQEIENFIELCVER